MRYSGPKMILRHPVLAIFHIIDGYIYKPKKKASKAEAPSAKQDAPVGSGHPNLVQLNGTSVQNVPNVVNS